MQARAALPPLGGLVVCLAVSDLVTGLVQILGGAGGGAVLLEVVRRVVRSPQERLSGFEAVEASLLRRIQSLEAEAAVDQDKIHRFSAALAAAEERIIEERRAKHEQQFIAAKATQQLEDLAGALAQARAAAETWHEAADTVVAWAQAVYDRARDAELPDLPELPEETMRALDRAPLLGGGAASDRPPEILARPRGRREDE